MSDLSTQGSLGTGDDRDWPAAPGELTSDWLADVLSSHFGFAVPVEKLEAERIGTGQVGECWRFRFESTAPDVPKTLVAKFAASDPVSRAAGVTQQCYRREVGFYRDLQAHVKVRTPRCYFAALAENEADHVLLLEDVATASTGDQLAGCSPVEALGAIRELALLHGPVWGTPLLDSLTWLELPTNEYRTQVMGMFSAFAEPFLKRFDEQVDPTSREIVEWIALNATRLVQQPAARTACHHDFRIDNLLFGGSATAPEVTVVDWQTMRQGSGPQDAAYLLGGSLTIEDRQRHEGRLLEEYHRTLLKTGVTGYDFDQCWADYRRSTIGGVLMAVISAMLVGATARGDAMFLTMLRRHSQHMVDQEAKTLLS